MQPGPTTSEPPRPDGTPPNKRRTPRPRPMQPTARPKSRQLRAQSLGLNQAQAQPVGTNDVAGEIMCGDEQPESRQHGNPIKSNPMLNISRWRRFVLMVENVSAIPPTGLTPPAPMGASLRNRDSADRWAKRCATAFPTVANQTPRRANATRTDNARNHRNPRGKGLTQPEARAGGGKSREKRNRSRGETEAKPKGTETPRPTTGAAAPPRRATSHD